jgi:hypothetical protein
MRVVVLAQMKIPMAIWAEGDSILYRVLSTSGQRYSMMNFKVRRPITSPSERCYRFASFADSIRAHENLSYHIRVSTECVGKDLYGLWKLRGVFQPFFSISGRELERPGKFKLESPVDIVLDECASHPQPVRRWLHI